MPFDEAIIEQIHAAGRPLVLAATGGGSGAISTLLQTPGASASVLAAVVPYASSALCDWLGGTPDQACSERTARAMAMAAFQRARELSDAEPRQLRGIGTTASLASNRPKHGPHRIHVAWQSATATVVQSLELTKGARTRAEEESIASQLTLSAVAEACDTSSNAAVHLDGLNSAERVTARRTAAPVLWSRLLLGEVDAIVCDATVPSDAPWVDLSTAPSPKRPRVLFSGAFNPVHDGHRQMAAIAAERLGASVTWELSIMNVDKPPLDFIEIEDRLAGLTDRQVLLTRVATFAEKSAFVPGCTFVVGVDTIERMGALRYYGHDEQQREAAIRKVAEQGCRFLVFGRNGNGRFRGLSDMDLPLALKAICDEVPESAFRVDVASSQIRTGC
jgi:nicotinamide mononucleotide (NMN) deamidase PncC